MARLSRAFARRPLAVAIDALETRRLLAATELISNGSFAANGSGWTLTGDFHADAAFSTTNGRSNPGYGYLSAADGTLSSSNNLVGTLAQSVTLPANLTSATLTFWWKATTEETGGSSDSLALRIKSSAGVTVAAPFVVYNQTNGSYVSSGNIDLASFAGQTITVSFEGQTNETLGTVFRVDDVSLTVDVPTPAIVSAPIMAYPGVPTTTGLPTLNTPVPTVRWNPVAGATGYGVIVQQLLFGSYTTIFNSEASSFPSPIKGTTFTLPMALSTGNIYRWQVRAFDGSGNATSYAPSLYFKVNTSGYNRAVGIDISNFQTISSWSTVKTNGTTSTTTDDTSFVYAKATEGFTFNDAKYLSHAAGAASASIPFGAYHFARPGNNSAADEAQHFYSIISNQLTAGNMTPMLDFEDEAANSVALGKTALSKWLNDFGDAFVALSGIVPIVYTFVSYATSYLDTSVIRYPLWQAQYPSSAVNPAIPLTSGAPSGTSPWPAAAWSMWQYTSKRTVAGISSGNVDADVTNSDIPTFYDMFKIPSSAATGQIQVTVFEDANNSGARDNGEAGIAGRTVFIDADGDGVLDPGESTAVTNASGVATFTNLRTGEYQIRQVVPTGSAATTVASQSFYVVAGQITTLASFGSRTLDVTPPAVTSGRFDYDAAAQTITLHLSEDVGSTLTADDATLTLLGTSTTIPLTLSYDAATLTATFTPTTPLPDGQYHFAIDAAHFADAAGNPNAAYTLDFFSLRGDITRDGAVGFDDLLVLSQNYGTETGATFAQGDLTFDGAVNFDDLLVLSQAYGNSALRQPAIATPTTKVKKPARRNDVLA